MANFDSVSKLTRAKHHLNELEVMVQQYRDAHPYRAERYVEGRGKNRRDVWRLQITQQPPAEIPLILGDFLYNVRSALDYLAAELVRPSETSRSFFPILSCRVWDMPVVLNAKGVDPLADDRRRWASIENMMAPDVVAILKDLQPTGQDGADGEMNALTLLNQLSNKDRHRRLTVVAPGLGNQMLGKVTLRNGRTVFYHDPSGKQGRVAVYQHNTAIGPLPPDTEKVEITEGTVLVVVEVRPRKYLNVPDEMTMLWESACMIVGHLEGHRRKKR